MDQLDPNRVEEALREVIARVDYDLHKELLGDGGEDDRYPYWAGAFLGYYARAGVDE